MQHTSRGDEPFASGLHPEHLLALYRGDVRDPVERARLEQWAESDAVAKLHWQSLRYFDAEQDAARHDARALGRFDALAAGDAPKLVACTDGEVFEPLWRGLDRAFGRSREKWAEVCQRCVYCRRMRRVAFGRLESRSGPLHGEPLLRERLLAPYYERVLAEKTAQLVGLVEETVRPHLGTSPAAAEEPTGFDLSSTDTALDLARPSESALEPTPLPAPLQRAPGPLPPLHAWLVALCRPGGRTPEEAAALFRPHFALAAEDVETLLQSASRSTASAGRESPVAAQQGADAPRSP